MFACVFIFLFLVCYSSLNHFDMLLLVLFFFNWADSKMILYTVSVTFQTMLIHLYLLLGSKEANVQAKEISSITCVDVGAIDTDHRCKNAISHFPLEKIEEKLATEKKYLKLDAATESNCLSHEQHSDLNIVSSIPCVGVEAVNHDHCCDSASLHSHPGTMEEDLAMNKDYLESKFLSHEQQSELDDNGCRNFLSEQERGGSNASSPSPRKSQSDCGLTVSPSSVLYLTYINYICISTSSVQKLTIRSNVYITWILCRTSQLM